MQSAAGPGGGKIMVMNSPRYVHLRLHSEYSVTDGIVRVGDAVKRAAGVGFLKPLSREQLVAEACQRER